MCGGGCPKKTLEATKLHTFPVIAKDVELELLVCMEKSMSRRTSSSLPLSEAGERAIGWV